jgi:hypothetical protein
MMRALTIGLAAVLLVACGGATAGTASSDGRHPIVFHRTAHAGYRWHTVVSSAERTTQTMAMANVPAESQTNETTLAMEADAEILAASPSGDPTAVRYVVSLLTRIVGGGTPEVLARPGAVIEVQLAATPDAAVVLVDGAPASAELREHIGDLVTLAHRDRMEVSFGTSEPQAVGDTWFPDLNAIAASMAAEASMVMLPERSSCTMTLRAREERGGLAGSLIEGTMASSGIEMRSLPAGATLRESRLALAMRAFLTDDDRHPPLDDQLQMEMHVVMDVATPVGVATLTMEAANRRIRTNRPL